MVNLITPSNNKPIPASVEPNRSLQSPGTATNTTQTSPNTPQTALIQWASVQSNTQLNTQQISQLVELNPNLAKILIAQIKSEPQSTNTTLLPQNIALLKQSPLQLLALTLDKTTIRIVTPSNINTLLNASTNTQLPIVKTQNGWQIASGNELKTALQTAAAQLLKQNLPLQTSNMPLFKIAQTLSDGKPSVLAHLPKTQAHIQALTTHNIDVTKIQNPPALGRELTNSLKANTAIGQIATIQQSLDNEVVLKNKPTVQSTNQALTQLEKSLQQLQNVIKIHVPSINNNALTTASTLQNNIDTLLNNKQILTPIQLNHTNQANKALLTLIETAQKNSTQENISQMISQQLNILVKPLNNISSNLANTPANNAIMQLLGIALHGQQLDQNILQQKTQQQLKTLLDQVSAKLQINQLRHLGLDAPRETTTPIIQQLQGELPLRFNEQILPLTYHIQGFDEKEPEQENGEKNNETKEKTRRWQVFMSFDLPNNEILHCKLSLIDNHINTTLWAESAKLCQKTQQLIGDLKESFSQAGLTVETLQCFEGKPPQDETSLSYNLVDVTT